MCPLPRKCMLTGRGCPTHPHAVRVGISPIDTNWLSKDFRPRLSNIFLSVVNLFALWFSFGHNLPRLEFVSIGHASSVLWEWLSASSPMRPYLRVHAGGWLEPAEGSGSADSYQSGFLGVGWTQRRCFGPPSCVRLEQVKRLCRRRLTSRAAAICWPRACCRTSFVQVWAPTWWTAWHCTGSNGCSEPTTSAISKTREMRDGCF